MRLGVGLGIALTGAVLAWLVGRLPDSRRSQHSRRRRDAGAVLVLTGVTALFFWPVLLAGYAFPKGGGDLWGQLYPVWSFIAGQVRQGVWPLWDPLLMAGDPILSEAQYGLFNPLNWSLFVLSPPPVQVVLWRGMVSLLLAGVGTYLFLTRSPGLRLSQAAGLLGASAYMLADPLVVHLGHPQVNDALAWLPWGLLGLDWVLAAPGWRRAPRAGVSLALMVLAGHGQMALYGLIAVGLYGLWRALTLPASAGEGRPVNRFPLRPLLGRLGQLALVALVGFALAAPVLLPAIERMPWSNRSLVPADQRRGYEFFPALLADTLAPHIHGRGADGWWSEMDRVESGYVGAVTLFLAGLGLMARRRQALFWVGLGGLALVLALGYQAPLYATVARWPFFDDLWKTARAISVTALALAVLGALGLQALLQDKQERWAKVWSLALLTGAAGIVIAAPRLLDGIPAGSHHQRALSNLRLVALLALATVGIAWSWRRWRAGWAPAGIVLLLVGELVALGALAETDRSPPLTGPDHSAALAFLRGDPGWFRVDAQGSARHLWSPETLQVQGFETLQGSGNPLSLWPFEQFYWAQPSKVAPGYRLLGAKYIIMPKGDLPAGEGIWPVFMDDPSIDVHLNTLALPRAWLVYRTEPVADYGAARRRLQSPDFAPEVVAVVENGPHLDGQGSGRIEVVRYSPNEVRLIVHTDTPALLVLSDVYYPGWQGDVDGASVPIYRTDATFRGVVVPAGSHEVRMRFRPRSFQVGLAMAAGSLLVLLLTTMPRRGIWPLCCKDRTSPSQLR